VGVSEPDVSVCPTAKGAAAINRLKAEIVAIAGRYVMARSFSVISGKIDDALNIGFQRFVTSPLPLPSL
jgi:hypothetical protein